jgi:hypothetical protein
MQSFPWKLWANVALRLQIKLINWSNEVMPPPGPGFKVDDLKVYDWKTLALPIINESKNSLNIIRWTAGMCSLVVILSRNANCDPQMNVLSTKPIQHMGRSGLLLTHRGQSYNGWKHALTTIRS